MNAFLQISEPRRLPTGGRGYGLASGQRGEGLFRRVAEHRELFFRYSWVDYSTHKPGTFRLSPPEHHLASWRADYREMLGPMFFGETPTFEAMIAAASEFERVFNATA